VFPPGRNTLRHTQTHKYTQKGTNMSTCQHVNTLHYRQVQREEVHFTRGVRVKVRVRVSVSVRVKVRLGLELGLGLGLVLGGGEIFTPLLLRHFSEVELKLPPKKYNTTTPKSNPTKTKNQKPKPKTKNQKPKTKNQKPKTKTKTKAETEPNRTKQRQSRPHQNKTTSKQNIPSGTLYPGNVPCYEKHQKRENRAYYNEG
jgi:hypothetical protein